MIILENNFVNLAYKLGFVILDEAYNKVSCTKFDEIDPCVN